MSERGWLALVCLVGGCQSGAPVDEVGSSGASETGSVVPTTGGDDGSDASGSSSESGSSDESGSSSGGVEDCGAGDLLAAPAPVQLADGLAVAIDVLELSGHFSIHVASESSEARAELRFRVGPVAGRPIFDLRQEGFIGGTLDGEELTADDLPQHDLGGGPGTEMRVLAAELPACSEHVLWLRYPLAQPPGFSAPPPEFKEDGVAWDLAFNDVAPRMFLEQWLPANLIFDQHPIAITVEVVGAAADQRLISNAEVAEVAPGLWNLEWPAHSTALSPMLLLVPGARVESSSMAVELAGGQVVGVEVHRALGEAAEPAALHELLAKSLVEFTASTGEYAFPRFTAFVRANGGMEYDGATTSSVGALRHELFHSWYGRGVRPASARDGWIDEAWTEYNTGTPVFPVEAIDPGLSPTTLRSANPWSRTTPLAAYEVGKAVFAAIADEAGLAPLQASMREFYGAHVLGRASTEELERHLHCSLATPAVRTLFHRHVYGLSGAPGPAPDDYCGP